jgi:hypothetical protein
MFRIAAAASIAILLLLVVSLAPSGAAGRGTFVMNQTKHDVTLLFRAGSHAIYEEIRAGDKRVVNWDDHGSKSPKIDIEGCGKRQTLDYTLTTTHSVLLLTGECSAHLQPGRN